MTSPKNPMLPLSQLQPQSFTWLWQHRLADGKLAMFDGDPGRGKSLVTLDLCAHLTTGRPMPDGTGVGAPANVLIIQGEDDAGDTVVPRLHALGADLCRAFVFRREFLRKFGPFSLPSQTKFLGRTLAINQPRLLVIDPIMAFLDRNVTAYNDQSIRRALTPLADLANQYRCACVMVRHLNKTGASRSLYRGGGSIGFNAACRSSWLFDFDADDPNRLIMAQIKNNIAPPQESLAYQIVRRPDAPPLLEWLGPSPLTCDQLLGAGRKLAPASLKEIAQEFLPDFLEEGPRPTNEIWEAGQELGLQRRTLQNARDDLGISSQRVWNGEKQLTYWLLPGQKLPDSIPAEHRADDVDDLFTEVRKQYPLDPLDDEE